MSIPPIVPLGTRLEIPSLVVLEGPDPYRGLRIRLEAWRAVAPQIPARGYLTIGGTDGDVALPQIESFMMVETREGDFVSNAEGVYSRNSASHEPLPPYSTIEVGPYLFMFVPPTPDGLGIPPDYPGVTVAKSHPLHIPSLLVKAGYSRVLDRKFPIVDECVTVGGSLHTHAPLFRLQVEVAARLTKGVGDLAYFVEPMTDRCRVRVAGAHGERRILTPYASVWIDDWELTLIPAAKGVPF
jgi:hypothetical protein